MSTGDVDGGAAKEVLVDVMVEFIDVVKLTVTLVVLVWNVVTVVCVPVPILVVNV